MQEHIIMAQIERNVHDLYESTAFLRVVFDGITAAKHHPTVITADARDTTSPDPGWTGPGWPGPRRYR